LIYKPLIWIPGYLVTLEIKITMPLFRKKKSSESELNFADLEGMPLKEGDKVVSLRYDLGECRIIRTEEGLAYESLSDGRKVSWGKMIDAASKNQKVRKV
jgi:hypothetical protein